MAGLSKGSIDGCAGNRKKEQDSDGTMPVSETEKITKTCQRVSQMTRWWRRRPQPERAVNSTC